ncbi:MAG: class I SAM-dependent methyltransferase family protein [Candidatus Hodarchaeota archaeon]
MVYHPGEFQVFDLCIKVKDKEAQRAKTLLLENGLIDFDRKPAHQEGHVIFPIKDITRARMKTILGDEFELIKYECKLNEKKRKGNLASLLQNTIPDELMEFVPISFNILGKIIILELKSELNQFKEKIAENLVRIHPNIKSIYNKVSEREGDYRVNKFELLWGDNNPVTTHLENECKYQVNIEEVFFDPRLSNEHGRIVTQVNERSGTQEINILDLFCGVGPFIIPLAKIPRVRLWGVDLNPSAIYYLEQNLALNKIEKNKVSVYLSDANEFTSPEFKKKENYPDFDVILLNLPRRAHEFIRSIYPLLKNSGLIHWYTVAREFTDNKVIDEGNPDDLLKNLESLKNPAMKNPLDDICIDGLKVVKDVGLKIKRITRIKPYSPYKFIFCFDLEKLAH